MSPSIRQSQEPADGDGDKDGQHHSFKPDYEDIPHFQWNIRSHDAGNAGGEEQDLRNAHHRNDEFQQQGPAALDQDGGQEHFRQAQSRRFAA